MKGEHSRLRQLRLCFRQCHTVFLREKGWKAFPAAALMTVLICLVTGEDMFVTGTATETGCFTILSACIWTGMFHSLRSVCRERAIIKREHATGLHISSYILGRWLYEACICLVFALIINTIVWLANSSHYTQTGVLTSPWTEYLITDFLILFASDSLGLVISAAVRNENSAVTVMPFALILQLIMSGLIFPLKGFTKTLSHLMISRWGLNALCITARVSYLRMPVMKEAYEVTAANLTHMWMILAGFACIGVFLAVLVLEFIDSDPR